MYFSLLFPEKCNKFEFIQPVYFADLQLESICNAISTKYLDFDIKKYFYTLPRGTETIKYRQEIYRDLENNDFMILNLKKYTNRILACETCYSFYKQVIDEVKKGSYLLLTCRHYLSALELLKDTLEQAELTSKGFISLKQMLEETFTDSSFLRFAGEVRDTFAQMEELKLTLLIRDNEIRVLEDEESQDAQNVIDTLKEYIRGLDVPVDEAWQKKTDHLENLFPSPLETGPLENTVIRILRKSKPGIFAALKKFASFDFSPGDHPYVLLKNELAFYISFYEFERKVNQAGYFLEYPEVSEREGMELKGVYDIALAWKNRFSEYQIVPNDISYEKGKTFLVVTGPNQGGKTTLARAVGQSVYFMLLGLKAPCRFMRSEYFNRILTHFEVEESVETGAGKLKEELQRLKPMMTIYSDHSFVILNELFTTATTYDAKIMAVRVMKHFIAHHCLGIYVTHIQELADEEAVPGIQSMVAQVDDEDPSVRTFKILPVPAEGLGYSDSIVKKYGLRSEQVTERIRNL